MTLTVEMKFTYYDMKYVLMSSTLKQYYFNVKDEKSRFICHADIKSGMWIASNNEKPLRNTELIELLNKTAVQYIYDNKLQDNPKFKRFLIVFGE